MATENNNVRVDAELTKAAEELFDDRFIKLIC